MKWIENDGAANLAMETVMGQRTDLPTLKPGKYVGVFGGAQESPTDDEPNRVLLSVTSGRGPHLEFTDLEIPGGLTPGQRITFEINMRSGAGLMIKGQQFKLVDSDYQDLTGWTDLDTIYKYIQDHKIVLAEPKITKLEALVE